jgi:hypothetical protein
MKSNECLAGLQRMADAFGETLTEGRLEAITAALRTMPVGKWEKVVDHCIGEYRRFPVLSEILKAYDQIRGTEKRGVVTSRACSCGGSLVVPTNGRSGHAWYRREPFDGDAEAGARDREMNPHLWSILVLRICSTCGSMFAIAYEDFEFLFADGSRGAVKKGQLTECGMDWTERNPDLQRGERDQDTGARGDPAYGEWRLSIIRRLTKEKLKPPAVAKILQERIDDWPKQQAILKAEIAELEGTANWRDISAPGDKR